MKINLWSYIEATGPQKFVDALWDGLPQCEAKIQDIAAKLGMSAVELETPMICEYLSGYATVVTGKPCSPQDTYHLQPSVLQALQLSYRSYFDSIAN